MKLFLSISEIKKLCGLFSLLVFLLRRWKKELECYSRGFLGHGFKTKTDEGEQLWRREMENVIKFL
jgi:hypothetical protein